MNLPSVAIKLTTMMISNAWNRATCGPLGLAIFT